METPKFPNIAYYVGQNLGETFEMHWSNVSSPNTGNITMTKRYHFFPLLTLKVRILLHGNHEARNCCGTKSWFCSLKKLYLMGIVAPLSCLLHDTLELVRFRHQNYFVRVMGKISGGCVMLWSFICKVGAGFFLFGFVLSVTAGYILPNRWRHWLRIT